MVVDLTYKARHIKRVRRSRQQMSDLRDGLYSLAKEYQPLTIRQLFYRAFAAELIEKTHAEYQNVIVRLMGQMREEQIVPFEWIIDNTRWMRKPTTYSNLSAMLHHCRHTYRRAIWDTQDCYVEVWCESDSAAGILYPVTKEYDVPLMPCRGQPSKTFLYTAAQNFQECHKPVHLYYFGDYDKAGMDISDRIDRDLRRYLPNPESLCFERVAVNEGQIEQFRLPTRPPKDKRGGFDKTVELEAMTTEQIQSICMNCIEQHIDENALTQQKIVEHLEKETLEKFESLHDQGMV